MENQIATTVNQSKKLLELGIDRKTADIRWTALNWQHTSYYLDVEHSETLPKEFIPAWSLSALLSLLPSELEIQGDFGTSKYEVRIRKYKLANETNLYQIAYGNSDGLSKSWHDLVNTSEQENLLDAVFEMVCYLKENKLWK